MARLTMNGGLKSLAVCWLGVAALCAGCGNEGAKDERSAGTEGGRVDATVGTEGGRVDATVSEVPAPAAEQMPPIMDGGVFDRWRVAPDLIEELGATVTHSEAERLRDTVLYVITRKFFMEVRSEGPDRLVEPIMQPYLSLREEPTEVVAVMHNVKGESETIRMTPQGPNHMLLVLPQHSLPLRRVPVGE